MEEASSGHAPALPWPRQRGMGGGGPPGVMDSRRKATAAGKQRMVARLTPCSSSPACSVRAPWGGGAELSARAPLPGQRTSLGKGCQA